MRRSVITVLAIVGGIALMAVSYFLLAAPFGASSVDNSNPRVEFSPALFVLGVMLVFGSALFYELLPGRRGK